MRAGKTDADAYLEAWRNGGWQEQDGSPEAVLNALVEEIETSYTEKRLEQLVHQGGWEADRADS